MRTTALVITLAALLFAYFVWPTPWQYLNHQFLATRVHRATGHAQILTADGWRAVATDYVDETSERVRLERLNTAINARMMHRDAMAERRQARPGGMPPGGTRSQRGEGERTQTPLPPPASLTSSPQDHLPGSDAL